MFEELNRYQQKIIEAIFNKIKYQSKEIFIEMATGTGKLKVIKGIAAELPEKNILFIARSLPNARVFENQKNVTVTFYSSKFKENIYDIVILDRIESINEYYYQLLQENYSNAIFISFSFLNNHDGHWLENKKMDYIFSLQKAIQEGFINPNLTGYQFEEFIEKFLTHYNFNEIIKEYKVKDQNKSVRIDFLLKKNKQKIIVEVKGYYSRFIERSILNQAIEQILYYNRLVRNTLKGKIINILFVPCQIPSLEKIKYFNDKNVLILDIANILYLIGDDVELQNDLLKCISYDFTNIEVEEPLLNDIFIERKNGKKINNETPKIIEEATEYIQKLGELKPGKTDNSDKKYEKLCYDIISFLFGAEFTRMEKQNKTDDEMFRMDLICSLRGTSDIWKIFLNYYRSRYVVFEFKNYSEQIDQNLIYVTEKYLYDAVLRNVAFIVSRKGFSHNASKAAKGILTEDKKLILDLDEEDLINMLRMKADGLDASDYLLQIFDDYLMSISK